VRDELGAEVLPVAASPEWGITGNLTGGNFPVYRFLPGFTRGEGFFLALLRKDGDGEVAQPRPTRSHPTPLPKACNAACSWLNTPEKYAFTVENDTIVAVPREHQTAIAALQSRLKVLHSGVAVAAVKNNKLLPVHALAMSTSLRREAFTVVELELDRALMYLHRETLALPDYPIGYLLLTYRNVPIGFVKNVGNRANNLYPAEWRIRKNLMDL
jgi:NOL1/NOP2/fmu family ribosome biogenesis protein